MNQAGGHGIQIWLIGLAAVVALIVGWGAGWALAFALVVCGAVFGTVFWIGRNSSRPAPAVRGEPELDAHHR